MQESDGDALKETAVPRPQASLSLKILCGFAIVAAMYFARDLLIPLFLAILLALLLRPLFGRLQKLRISDFAAAGILILVVAVLVFFGISKLAGEAQGWLAHAPEAVIKVRKMLPTTSGPIGDIQKTTDAVKGLAKSENTGPTIPVEVFTPDLALTVMGVSGHLLASVIIVFVVAFFLLALSDLLLKQAVESRSLFYEKKNIVQLVQNVESGVSRYLLTVTLINVCLGALTALVLWILRIPNPILWGVMATTLNYVPHVGAFLCMLILFFVGAVTHESLSYGTLVAACFAAITFVESYFITPMTLSRSLQLSPLAVILSVLFWGWLWGISGGLMAAPLLAVAKIFCDQFEVTRPLSIILGEPEHRSRPQLEASTAVEPAQTAA